MILSLLLPIILNIIPISNNPVRIYAEIKKLNPNCEETFARDLSKYLSVYSSYFGTDPIISVAIAMQESSISNTNRLGWVDQSGKKVRGITDLGVFQIHYRTIRELKRTYPDLDVFRLQHDLEYQTFWHVKLLKKKITICQSKKSSLKISSGEEWSCYHSFTLDKRKIYVKAVNVHLTKLLM